MTFRRCKVCKAKIYWSEAVREWRHYDVVADHVAKPSGKLPGRKPR